MKIVSRQPSETGPARIGALSVLPVFLDLSGKRAIVAGGSEAAAWKAELLAAAGARVALYAAELSDEMTLLLARETGIVHHARDWGHDCFQDAAVALADAEDDIEAASFEKAARAAGVPCNVIDRPAFCHFQFGSIVNRSPVVIGVSTSGAAPILGQAVRRRIETLLPPSLAAWAGLAQRVREHVVDRLAPGAQRRRFWEAFVDRAFGPAPDGQAEEEVIAAIADPLRHGVKGKVTFVGAGPGMLNFSPSRPSARFSPPTSSCSTTSSPTRCWNWPGARPNASWSASAPGDRAASRTRSTAPWCRSQAPAATSSASSQAIR